jgi:hypothetical protein
LVGEAQTLKELDRIADRQAESGLLLLEVQAVFKTKVGRQRSRIDTKQFLALDRTGSSSKIPKSQWRKGGRTNKVP